MVDYDAAVAAVQDPNADPVLLAKIAYENPEFGANVAANDRAYPGLLRWIAEFGDDRAKEQARIRGYVADGTPTGHDEDAEQATAAQPEQQSAFAEAQPAADYAGQQATAAQQQPRQQTAAQPMAAQQPVATNQYGFTVAQALDPNTDQITIAQIAQYAPELRVYLAQNPSTYPELLNWLAQLNDPQINAALAQRG
ncbi:hypothetical protein KIH77_04775 [Bifidobacterium sp. 82T24]|uniref:variant leucine-rich repeat-containing protein n=1 Tax=Bifidobacterium pluvialisilvae TaxID=2834436 RepID=UPI001C58E7F2|nr:hypothetical protein [Bifidobacterium pluvialisilvae]MBW3088048.1 hypothetical protein [Bifidobacterium pluvialisilvae]